MELLMTQFNRGHMTTHMIGQVVGQIWEKIQDKFIKDENGLWYNERLDEEKIKRQNFTKSRRNNVSGNNQHSKKQENNKEKDIGHIDAHMTSHMENENIILLNNNKNIITNKNSISNGTWEDEKKYFIIDEQYQMGICSRHNLKKEQVQSYIEEFLSTIELNEDFKSSKELKRHFTNWINVKVSASKQKQYSTTQQQPVKIKLKSITSPSHD